MAAAGATGGEGGSGYSLAQLNTILQTLTEGVALLKDRRYVWINRAMTEISGYSEDDLIGQVTGTMYVSQEDYERVGTEAYAVIFAGGTYETEILIQRKDRERRWVRVKGRALDPSDPAQGTIWVMSDVTERRRAEAAMRERDQRYRDLFEGSRDAICVTDLSGLITDCNQAFLRLTGYGELAELKELSYLDLTPAEYHAMELNLLQTQLARRGYTDEYEKEYMRKDGSRVAISLRAILRRDRAGRPLEGWAWIRDISEHKQLRKAGSVLQLIMNYLPCGVSIFGPDLEMIQCNAKYRELLDFPDELFARELPSLPTLFRFNAMRGEFGPGDPEQITTEALEHLRHTEPHIFQRIRPNGVVLEARLNTLPGGGFIATFVDVTERKRTEAAILESQSLLSSIIGSAMDAIITVDEAHRILVFNSAAETMFRCVAADAIGQPLERFIPERFRAAHAIQMREFGATGTTFRPMGRPGVVTGLRADGEEFPVEATIARAKSGGRQLYMVMLRDVLGRIAAAEAQRDALVREVHHRIKNNLQGVIGLVRQHLDAHPELKVVAEGMLGQIRAIAIVHGMRSARAHDDVTLCEIVSEIGLAVREVSQAEIVVDLLREGRASIRLARDEAVPIALILNELLYNAIKHGQLGAGDGVRAAVSAEDGVARVSIDNPGALAAGFDFEQGVGIGTGLSLVKALLPRNGAKLEFVLEGGRVRARLTLSAPVIHLP